MLGVSRPRWAVFAALVMGALLTGVFGIASAQQGGETPAERVVSIDIGEWTYELEEDEPLTACVQETTTDFERTTARLIVFARLADGTVAPLGTFETAATAALEGVAVGDCLALGVDR